MVTYAERYGPEPDAAGWGAGGPLPGMPLVVKRLLLAHVAVYFALLIARQLLSLEPAQIYRALALVPERALGSGWVWQFATYLFVHDLWSPWHIFFNLLVLYFFAGELAEHHGARRFLGLYFGAGAFAGLAHCALSWGALPLLGASGAVYAVLVAYATLWPRRTILLFFILPIQAWLLVGILIALSAASFLIDPTGGSGISELAHLTGGAFGYGFVRYRQHLERLLAGLVRRQAERQQRRQQDLESRLDELLDKIHREGMAALSPREREFLRQASRHYQRRH
ncbi:MAG: rhomboid family intramembrane serine protease [Planctomycetota bacterium]|nr:MAG: rhomboid family intramembrane serine protease [Planctomycetota bacterium]